MSKIGTFFSLMKTPGKMIQPLGKNGLLRWMPDKLYLKLLFYCELGKKLNLDNPQSFNEKLQWLKLYDRNPEYISWVDKYQAKENVRKTIGDEYVVPIIGVWEKAEDIDFNSLPDKCVLKCNHDQGSTIIYDHTKDKRSIIKFYRRRLKKNPYIETREWPYKYVKPKIICEPFLAENIIDYKFFCCNGKVIFVNIGQMDHKDYNMHITFVDLNWNPLSFQRSDHPRVNKLPEKPELLDKMVELAEIVASGKRFVRVDFYVVNNHIYFSEFTLYPTLGLIPFVPEEGDNILGAKLKL